MSKTDFSKQLGKLNRGQKQAVDAIDGPVMVIAGPGTGKTTILTSRIANTLLKTDTPPDAILALTFTESGVSAMRKKLISLIGASAYRVHIHTFHSFCNELIQSHPDAFENLMGAQHVTDHDQIVILEECIQEANLSRLRPATQTFFYLKEIRDALTYLKREDINVTVFKKYVSDQHKNFKKNPDLYYVLGKFKGEMKGIYRDKEKKIKNNLDLALLYEKYQEKLSVARLYDYSDMLMEAVRVLARDSTLLLTIQEKYHYILADEHQDANNAQNHLLELLSSFHENPNLFIVGDEKQAIFRFQGASLENFLYFKRKFPDAVLIRLEENYRSPRALLQGVHSLILHNSQGGEIAMPLSSTKIGAKIRVLECESEDDELGYIGGEIQKKIKEGVLPHEIAVLFRNNKDALAPKMHFESLGIPVTVHAEGSLYDEKEISRFLMLLRAVHNFGEDSFLSRVLFFDFLLLDHLDVYKLLRFSSTGKKSLYAIMRNKKDLRLAGVVNMEAFMTLGDRLHSWSYSVRNKGVIEAVEKIAHESGFLSHLIADAESLTKLSFWEALLNEIKNAVEREKNLTVEGFLATIDRLAKHAVSVKAKNSTERVGKVQLMTAHKAKGLEFEYVYVIGSDDSHWIRKKRSFFLLPEADEEGEVDDERRLFYVALTRAKKEASISYSLLRRDGKETFPLRFIAEIDQNFIRFEKKKKLPARVLPRIEKSHDMGDQVYLRTLFLEHGFSVSALNNYLACPWRFFFVNLIRVPHIPEKPQLYGTAVHEALKYFFDKYKEEEDITKLELLHIFENYLTRKHLPDVDFRDLLAKGKKALGGYYDTYKKMWRRELLTEFSVHGVILQLEHEKQEVELLLTGKLDKLEFTEQGVTVVDYKTGKQRTRNEIEGKTKNSHGDYKRQIVFYQLLLNRFDSRKYNMVGAELDFIEPDEKGRYKKEKFVITPEEVRDLEKEIISVAKEILDLSFWNKTCDDKDCEFCELSEAVKKSTKK